MERSEFIREVEHWSKVTGLKPKDIHIRRMVKKWGSCSSRGRLTFNSSLLDEDKRIRDQVIVHELLHIRYASHSKMFKALMRMYTEGLNE